MMYGTNIKIEIKVTNNWLVYLSRDFSNQLDKDFSCAISPKGGMQIVRNENQSIEWSYEINEDRIGKYRLYDVEIGFNVPGEFVPGGASLMVGDKGWSILWSTFLSPLRQIGKSMYSVIEKGYHPRVDKDLKKIFIDTYDTSNRRTLHSVASLRLHDDSNEDLLIYETEINSCFIRKDDLKLNIDLLTKNL